MLGVPLNQKVGVSVALKKKYGGAGRARTDDDRIMSSSSYGSTRVLKFLLSND